MLMRIETGLSRHEDREQREDRLATTEQGKRWNRDEDRSPRRGRRKYLECRTAIERASGGNAIVADQDNDSPSDNRVFSFFCPGPLAYFPLFCPPGSPRC